MTDAERIALRAQWEQITARPPVVAELHPGGPDGEWLSISLTDETGDRFWLHFRKVALYLQCAFGDDDTKPARLQWDIVEDIEQTRNVMLEFAENFEESRAAHSIPPDE